MPTIVPVRFTYAARDLWFDAGETGAAEGDHLICSTERGTEIGLATAEPREVAAGELPSLVGDAALKPVLRVATDDDLALAEELAVRGEQALPTFRRLAHGLGLDMKPVGVEYVFGGERVVCYFSAEGRVDFRQLVRELSRELHARVDMRQIGVREQAAIVGGYGHCGQELCCARFGLSFDPVSIRMAKEQDLPLNSNKISGACGRLMCCLRYEFEAYRDFKGRAPKKNAVIQTPLGTGKIVEYDTPKESLAIRLASGKTIRVALADMTASDAAVKKSQELGCPCRPDTVSRSVLERLQSPDVQMALAELDRKAGVLPKEGPDEADIFVSTRPRRRRGQGQGGSDASRGDGRPSRSRGQASRTGSGAGPASGEDRGQARGGQQPRRRARRRQDLPETAPEAEGASVAPSASSEGSDQQQPRRRRHHRQAGGAGEGQPQGGQGRPSEAKADAGEGTASARPRRRHPGDRGGEKGTRDAAQGGRPDAAGGGRQGQSQGQAAGDGSTASDGTGTPRRRRRRRGGHSGGQQQAGGGQPQE